MIKITRGTGFHLSFPNGYTISVQIGDMNYCSRRNQNDPDAILRYEFSPESNNAEVAIWDKEGEFVTNSFIDCHGDDVIGYLDSSDVALLIQAVAEGKVRS